MKTIFIADFDYSEYPGGAEKVDQTIRDKLDIPLIKSKVVTTDFISSDHQYIISNYTGLSEVVKAKLASLGNYTIFEHDYKIHRTRQPNQFPNELFPKEELTNLDFIKAAKVVLFQSQDHLDCHIRNGVEGNLIALEGSIWSDKELEILENLSSTPIETHKFAIINTDNIWKGTREAVQFCKAANVQYDLLAKQPMFEFYQTLAGYPVLVYFPIVKESFCRLVVEAKAMNCNILTSKTYGAAKEPWFNLYGKAMTKFLVNATTNNIKILKRCW
jgi:hypothetical protein